MTQTQSNPQPTTPQAPTQPAPKTIPTSTPPRNDSGEWKEDGTENKR